MALKVPNAAPENVIAATIIAALEKGNGSASPAVAIALKVIFTAWHAPILTPADVAPP